MKHPERELRMRKVLPGRNFSFSFNFPPHRNCNSSQIVVFTAAENSQIVYIFYYMSKSDTIVTVTLDPSKCKNDIKKDVEDKSTIKSSKTKELLELKDMLEKELITKEEFEKLKSELLNINRKSL